MARHEEFFNSLFESAVAESRLYSRGNSDNFGKFGTRKYRLSTRNFNNIKVTRAYSVPFKSTWLIAFLIDIAFRLIYDIPFRKSASIL